MRRWPRYAIVLVPEVIAISFAIWWLGSARPTGPVPFATVLVAQALLPAVALALSHDAPWTPFLVGLAGWWVAAIAWALKLPFGEWTVVAWVGIAVYGAVCSAVAAALMAGLIALRARRARAKST